MDEYIIRNEILNEQNFFFILEEIAISLDSCEQTNTNVNII